jgi:hypothetical protein
VKVSCRWGWHALITHVYHHGLVCFVIVCSMPLRLFCMPPQTLQSFRHVL